MKNDESLTLSFAQLEGKCYCCGKAGHKSPDCRHKEKIPRDEWAINKAQSHAQAKDDEQSVTGTRQQIDQHKVYKRKTDILDGLEFTVPLPKELH